METLLAGDIVVGGARLSTASLVTGLAIVLLGFLLASWLSSRIRGDAATSGRRWRATLGQVVAYALRGLVVAIGLQVAGLDIGTVLAAGAVLAVGVGIAMQDVAVNFVSGVILLAERSIREGDIVEFDGRIARVRVMGLRATIAQALDGEEIIVPNSMLTQSAVKNLTLSEHSYRLRVRVGVSYGADLAVAERAPLEASQAMTWRDAEPEPLVLLTDFGSSSVDFEVNVWTRDVWGMRKRQSELRKAIWEALKAANVAIPFPQLDVHIDAPIAARTETVMERDALSAAPRPP